MTENTWKASVTPTIHTLGYKKYEITNYLGNVNAVITDRKLYSSGIYTAVVLSNSDYYPFGMEMPGRNNNISSYRFGYNGMELDNEAKGNGNSYTTEFRQYDPRLGRWLSLDPLMNQFPWMSPYVAFDDNPIYFNDPLGLAAEGGGDPLGKTASKGLNDAIKSLDTKVLSALKNTPEIELENVIVLGHRTFMMKVKAAVKNIYNHNGSYPRSLENPDELDHYIAKYGIETFAPKPPNIPKGVMQWEKDLAKYNYEARLENWEKSSLKDKWQSTRQNIIISGIRDIAQEEMRPVAELYTIQATLGGSGMATGPALGTGTITKVTESVLGGGTVTFSARVSSQKMLRHLFGSAGRGKSYFHRIEDAQAVLDAYNSGNYVLIGENVTQNEVTIQVKGAMGRYVNQGNPNGMPDVNKITDVFTIQSSRNPKVIPVNPSKAIK